MKKSKKFLALALLVPVLITFGCGSSGEQEKAAETGAETAEADASEIVGAGTGENTELDVSEADNDTETEKETETIDFAFIDEWITSIEDNKTELTLIITHHIKEAKSVEFTYQDVLLDGVTVENWEAHGRGADTFTIDPNAFQSFPQTLTLGTNIDNFSELTVHATANFDDGTEPYPFSATFQINELERKIEEKAATSSKGIYLEEQELYNDNGVIIIVTGIEDGRSGYATELRFQSSGSKIANFDELYIGDTLMYSISQELRTDGIEVIFENGESGESSQVFVYVMNEDVKELIREELPEISVVYRIYDGKGSNVQTSKLTFPVLSR